LFASLTVNVLCRLKDELLEEMLANCKLVILGGVNAPMGDREVQILKQYIDIHGGSVLVLGESYSTTHYYNAVTQNFGITVVKGNLIH
jgi:hypothetical protein